MRALRAPGGQAVLVEQVVLVTQAVLPGLEVLEVQTVLVERVAQAELAVSVVAVELAQEQVAVAA
jgi:hypothetical protein